MIQSVHFLDEMTATMTTSLPTASPETDIHKGLNAKFLFQEILLTFIYYFNQQKYPLKFPNVFSHENFSDDINVSSFS